MSDELTHPCIERRLETCRHDLIHFDLPMLTDDGGPMTMRFSWSTVRTPIGWCWALYTTPNPQSGSTEELLQRTEAMDSIDGETSLRSLYVAVSDNVAFGLRDPELSGLAHLVGAMLRQWWHGGDEFVWHGAPAGAVP